MCACFRVLSYNLVLGHFFYFSTFAALSTYFSGCVLCPFDNPLFFALYHYGSRYAELSLPSLESAISPVRNGLLENMVRI